jgi:hypothetical protein
MQGGKNTQRHPAAYSETEYLNPYFVCPPIGKKRADGKENNGMKKHAPRAFSFPFGYLIRLQGKITDEMSQNQPPKKIHNLCPPITHVFG